MKKRLRRWLTNIYKFLQQANWPSIIAALLLGLLVGIITSQTLLGTTIDGGLATLVGSALGAGVTVAGSLWVAKFQISASEKSFARFVAEATAAIRDETYVLTSLIEQDIGTDLGLYANKLKQQVSAIKEAIEIFRANAPFAGIGNYEARLWITRMENEINTNLRILDKELNWLDHPTLAVIENSQGDLGYAAERIFQACVGVHRELEYSKDLPDDDELRTRISVLG